MKSKQKSTRNRYKLMINFQPKDIIALVALVGIGLLKIKGVDGQLDISAALIIGYYFAHRIDGTDKGV